METKELGPMASDVEAVSRRPGGVARSVVLWGLVLFGLGVSVGAHAQWRFQSRDMGSGVVGAGSRPYAKLIEGPDGALYGVTRYGGSLVDSNSGYGTLFKVGKDGGDFRVLHYFGDTPDDGLSPSYAALAVGTNKLIYGVANFGGTWGEGTVFRIDPGGSNYVTLHHFHWSNDGGSYPRGQLVLGDDGAFYGTTDSSVFRIDHAGTDFRVLYRWTTNQPGLPFDIQAGVIKGSDGWLYGTSQLGGLTNPIPHGWDAGSTMGTIFRVRQNGGAFEVLHQFEGPTVGDGYAPRSALFEASDGMLYGATISGGIGDGGTLFRVQRDGTAYQVIYPAGGFGEMVEGSDGALYGSWFKILKDGSGFTLLAGDGRSIGGLCLGSDGKFYAVDSTGIYVLEHDGSGFSWLFRFPSSFPAEQNPRAPLLTTSTRAVIGTTESGAARTNGAVFIVDLEVGHIRVMAEPGLTTPAGKQPNGMAEGTNGFLYGTTQLGGSNNLGVIFRTDADGRGLTNLHYFGSSGAGDGRSPRVALVSGHDGYLYGAGYVGGTFGRGTIFKIREDGTGYATLYHFGTANPDGQGIQAALVIGPDGGLYGVANGGGSGARGTVFRLNRDGTGYVNLRHFAGGSDGANPQAPLLLGSDGYFYGSTTSGGNGFGTIYRLKPDGSDYRVLYRPTSALQGNAPRGPMVETPRGVLWGCGSRGGTNNSGVIFRATMDGSDYRVAWLFAGGPAGMAPLGGLTLDRAGWVTGTTAEGGAMGFGTVFRLDPGPAYLRHEIVDGNLIVRWERGSGVEDVETATEWIDGRPLWQPRAADIEVDGNTSRAVFPLQAVRQVLIRVRQDPE